MKVKIYGHSDDLVEIEGDISDEIDAYSKVPKLYVYYNDVLQFVIKISFTGTWNIRPELDKEFCEDVVYAFDNWNIRFKLRDLSLKRYSNVIEIDSGDDIFEIKKKRKKVKS